MKNKKEIFILLITFTITSAILGILGFIFLSFSRINLNLPDKSNKEDSQENKLSQENTKKVNSNNQHKSNTNNNQELKQLKDFLEKKDFKRADSVTDIILKHEIISSQILDLDCNLINEIDDLWQKNSNDKFGYSEQLKIWEQIQVTKEENSLNSKYSHFQQTVGWIKNGKVLYQPDLDYKLTAPIAHLPWSSWQVQGRYRYGFGEFMEKVKACQS